MTHHETPVEVTRHFIEALNARDVETLRDSVTEDAEFRTPEGKALVGHDGVDRIVKASADARVLLARDGEEAVEGNGVVTHVTVPVRETIGKNELRGTAQFELRDGKVAAFEVVTAA
jgi:ketosteroid isomerase-like protein